MKRLLLIASTLVAVTLPALAELQLWDGKVWVTGQERLRLEYRENNVTFNNKLDKDTDLWLLQRSRFGLGVKPCDWVRVYGELQDAREIDSQRFPAPPLNDANLEEDTIDWRQGWVEIANYKEFPVGFKIGRQELSYGDERLIGSFDWNNAGRVFDAVKFRWQGSNFWVEVFAGDVVLNNVASGNRDNSFDDRSYWQDDFYGVYAQTTALSFQVTEGYVLLRDKDDNSFDGPAREIWTIGARVKSKAKFMPWDYYAEIAGQVGEVDGPGQGPAQNVARRFGDNSLKSGIDHTALAAVVGGGFTFTNCCIKPRIGLEYNYASGDGNPNDRESHTFDNLYPTNHKFFGYMDLFAWKNIHNPRATLNLTPHKNVGVQLDYHLFWLADSEDFWYRANQAPVGVPARRDATGNSGDFVGSEIDLTVNWNVCKYAKVQGGYSHFFHGDFVTETEAGNNGNNDADFVYVQTTLSF